MTFLSPLLLSGLALASVPVIIHLLNRRRFIRVDWAPMKYLKLTIRKNRRRIQLEQWLLLALRVLAVAALFFAVARPIVSESGFARLLAAQGKKSRIIVLDDSLSMGAEAAGATAFSRGKQAVADLLRHASREDTVTLMTVSQARTPIVRDVHIDNVDALVALVQALEPSAAANSWASTLEAIDVQVQAASASTREVVLLTDLRAAGWDTRVSDVVDRWAEREVGLQVIDLGSPSTENVWIESLTQVTPVALAGTPTTLLAKIRNSAAEPFAAQEATLAVDGKPQSILLPEIPARGEIDAPVVVTLDKPGMHAVNLALPRDRLPADGIRYASLDVRSSLAVQVVDGEPEAKAFESETDFLELAFSVGRAPWQVMRSTDSQWAANPLVGPDALVLANVSSITEQRAAELLAQVEAGLGLMIFPGEQVDPSAYNRTLYREGRGLLPAEIVRVREEEAAGLVLESFPDSPLAPMAQIKSDALAKIRPKRFTEVAIPPDAGDAVRVLARWNDARQSPAVIEKRIGEGRVLFWTITADKKWSDWPMDGSYVLAMRQTVMGVVSRSSDSDNVIAGQPLRHRLDQKGIPSQAAVKIPGREAAVSAIIDSHDPKNPELRFDETSVAGDYRMEWTDPLIGPTMRLFAVNPDSRECDLTPLRADELQSFIGKLGPTIVRYGESADSSPTGSELWRSAVWALLAFMLAESCLAAWIGRDSKPVPS